MDIDKFAGGQCDFCDYRNSKPCLSCVKIIMYESQREAWLEFLREKEEVGED